MNTAAKTMYQHHRLTVADYHRMGQVGIFSVNDRVELIEGEIIDMAPIGSEHAGVVARLTKVLTMAVGDKAVIWTQNPIRLSSYSEPEPDIAILKPRDDFYRTAHPRPEDVLLIIEVADNTLRYDREVKAPLYARHGVPELWLVDLENRCLEMFRAPAEAGYQEVQGIERPSVLTPVALPDVSIDLKGLF
jgi:Uma2 family endonuclease